MKTEPIKFYRTRDDHGYCSNFARFPVTLDGFEWPTSEHYFQAKKFHDPAIQEKIRQAATPSIAASMGRDRAHPLREDWESVKDEVMYQVVRAKFTQHLSIRRRLFETGGAELIEHTYNDRYWGDGGDGSGLNMLGKILMKVRHELMDEEFSKT